MWEYLTIECSRHVNLLKASVTDWDRDIPAELNQLGQQGWNLIHVVSTASAMGKHGGGVTTDEVWIFKRPKAE